MEIVLLLVDINMECEELNPRTDLVSSSRLMISLCCAKLYYQVGGTPKSFAPAASGTFLARLAAITVSAILLAR